MKINKSNNLFGYLMPPKDEGVLRNDHQCKNDPVKMSYNNILKIPSMVQDIITSVATMVKPLPRIITRWAASTADLTLV